MRVFVSGATGFVGSAVVKELLAHGHAVLAGVRSDEAAERARGEGAEPIHAVLEQPDTLAEAARQADATIHTAFDHDFSRWGENIAKDRRVVDTLIEALAGSNKPLVISSGVALVAPGRVATEADPPIAEGPVGGRGQTENALIAAAERGIATAVVRLPPTTHGAGDKGFIPILMNVAREKGVAAYVGDGANHWPAGHRLDAAAVYRLAVERGEPGARWHAIAEEGVPMREIAETLGKGMGLPVRSLTPEEAAEHFGFLGMFVGADIRASSAVTRERLGWTPREIGLLEDLAANYFN